MSTTSKKNGREQKKTGNVKHLAADQVYEKHD